MAATRWLDDTEMRAWLSLLQVHALLFDQLDRELQAHHGLSAAEYEVLVNLERSTEHRLRMSELADLALITRSRLTHTVDRLEREGLVEREACPTDRRGSFAVLTRTGYQRLAQAAPTHLEGVRSRLFDRLDPTQVAALADALEVIATDLASPVTSSRANPR
jgi:DNA-binding MarR family transcriptional regulator